MEAILCNIIFYGQGAIEIFANGTFFPEWFYGTKSVGLQQSKNEIMSGLQRIGFFGAVIAFFICTNIFGPGLLRNAHPWDFWQYSAFVAVGGLVSETYLLAIWVVLGSQAVKFRLPLTGAFLLVATCSFVIGLRLPKDRMPLGSAITFFGVAITMYCCMQVPLWIMRVITKRRIDLPAAKNLDAKHGSAQFGLRYLMICTTAVGVLVVLVKHTLPDGSLTGRVPWAEGLGVVAMLMALSAPICIPCIWLALVDKDRIAWVAWLAIVGLGWPLIPFFALVAIYAPPLSATGEVLPVIFLFELGAGGTTLLVLLVARLLGYRLIRPSTQSPTPDRKEVTREQDAWPSES